MPKKNDEDYIKKEKINEMLEDLKRQTDITEEDFENLKDFMEKIFKRENSKLWRVFSFLKQFLIKNIIFYLISLVVIGLFIFNISLSNIYHVFYIVFGVSFILSLFEVIPFIDKINHIYMYLILFGVILIDFCLFNEIYKIFNTSILWIVYIILIEIFYAIFKFYWIKRKFSF